MHKRVMLPKVIICLSSVIIAWTVISIAYILDIADTDHIIINSDKIECKQSFNNTFCKNSDECWLCAPNEVNRAIIVPPVIVILSGINICICSYMLSYSKKMWVKLKN